MEITTTVHTILQRNDRNARAIEIPNGPNLSFADLEKLVVRQQQQLVALGVRRQQAVAISLPNGLDFVVTFLAVTRAGMIAAPLNPRYKASEFEFYIEDLKPAIVIRDVAGEIDKAASKFGVKVVGISGGSLAGVNASGSGYLPPVAKADDIAFVLHTSGTTGRPKTVPLLHRNLLASVRNIISTYRFTTADKGYLVMPLFHVHGLVAGLLAPLAAGGSVVVASKFSAHLFWPELTAHNATWYTAVPTIHQLVLLQEVPRKLNLRFVRSCSAPLAPATFDELERRLNAPVLEAYAMTEACHQMSSNLLPPDLRVKGSVGVGVGVEIGIVDLEGKRLPPGSEGEIAVRGPNVMPGYLNNPKANSTAFTSEGFFRTGDVGKINKSGTLEIVGRIKELINRGGEKIPPAEIDAALLSHPAVAAAAAFGANDKLFGQRPEAAVVLRSGKTATEAELRKFISAKLASFKVPTRIYFVPELPKTPTGKVQRQMLTKLFAGADARAKL